MKVMKSLFSSNDFNINTKCLFRLLHTAETGLQK